MGRLAEKFRKFSPQKSERNEASRTKYVFRGAQKMILSPRMASIPRRFLRTFEFFFEAMHCVSRLLETEIFDTSLKRRKIWDTPDLSDDEKPTLIYVIFGSSRSPELPQVAVSATSRTARMGACAGAAFRNLGLTTSYKLVRRLTMSLRENFRYAATHSRV